jgi:hypothetical protein
MSRSLLKMFILAGMEVRSMMQDMQPLLRLASEASPEKLITLPVRMTLESLGYGNANAGSEIDRSKAEALVNQLMGQQGNWSAGYRKALVGIGSSQEDYARQKILLDNMEKRNALNQLGYTLEAERASLLEGQIGPAYKQAKALLEQINFLNDRQKQDELIKIANLERQNELVKKHVEMRKQIADYLTDTSFSGRAKSMMEDLLLPREKMARSMEDIFFPLKMGAIDQETAFRSLRKLNMENGVKNNLAPYMSAGSTEEYKTLAEYRAQMRGNQTAETLAKQQLEQMRLLANWYTVNGNAFSAALNNWAAIRVTGMPN